MQAGALDAIRVLHIGPSAPGLPALDWVSELGQIADVPGVRLELCLGKQAVRSAVASRLHEVRDCVLWSGHGAAGRLMLADGPVGADWLACMLKQQSPAVVVLAACFSGARPGAALDGRDDQPGGDYLHRHVGRDPGPGGGRLQRRVCASLCDGRARAGGAPGGVGAAGTGASEPGGDRLPPARADERVRAGYGGTEGDPAEARRPRAEGGRAGR